jgi:hypothetical protein
MSAARLHFLRARFLVWTSVLALASAFRWLCDAESPCAISAAARDAVAPRALGAAVAALGPAPAWLLVLLLLRAEGGSASARGALIGAAAAFLGAVFPMRLTSFLTDGAFDPSGHIFVFGLELVPLWAALSSPSPASQQDESSAYSAAPRCDPTAVGAGAGAGAGEAVAAEAIVDPTSSRQQIRAIAPPALKVAALLAEAAIYVMSASTAALFHTPMETAAAWLIAAALLVAVAEWQVLSPARSLRNAAALLAAPTLALWAAGLLAGIYIATKTGRWAILATQACFDGAVAAFCAVSVSGPDAEMNTETLKTDPSTTSRDRDCLRRRLT